MNILVVAATRAEIEPLLESGVWGARSGETGLEQGYATITRNGEAGSQSEQPRTPHLHLGTLITGVGMVGTAYALGRYLALQPYDLAINLGIAGSFDRSIELGEVVEVTHDTLGELGAEDGELFIPIETLGFGESQYAATASLSSIYTDARLKQVSGLTVNTVHGNPQTIEKLSSRLPVQVESMEGAAFFYACQQAGVPAMQIRAVSNYVEKRNRDAWKIGPAIKNLNSFAMELLRGIGSEV